jgi:hypothetical protein
MAISIATANGMQLHSCCGRLLESALSSSNMASAGLSRGFRPFGSSWHAVSTSPMEPRLAAAAAWRLGLSTVQWRRRAAMMGGAAGSSRSTFSSKVEDFGSARL